MNNSKVQIGSDPSSNEIAKRFNFKKKTPVIVALLCIIFITIGIFASQYFPKTKNDKNTTGPKSISGVIQKGPFISGSDVIIQELSNNLSPTGISYNLLISDDFGNYTLDGIVEADYIEVISSGYYFNEIQGQLSSSTLSLRAIADLRENNKVNVNILTALTYSRLKYLITTEQKSYVEAVGIVKTEILNLFNIPNREISTFDDMDISQNNESNAILLAMSLVVHGNQTPAEVSELISKISLDLETDGIVSDNTLIEKLKQNASGLIFPQVRTNLENRYKSLNHEIAIPQFELFAKRLVPLAPISTSPESGATDQDHSVKISVNFNKPINTQTIDKNTFQVQDDHSFLEGTYAFENENRTVIFTSNARFKSLDIITITLSTGVVAADEDEMDSEYKWDFTTARLDITSDLKLYYPFNGNSQDSSGNGYDAKAIGVTLTKDKSGKENSAYHFQNKEDYIEIPNKLDLSGNSWSLSMWFNLNTLPSTFGEDDWDRSFDTYLFISQDVWPYYHNLYLYVSNEDNEIKAISGESTPSGSKKVSTKEVVIKDKWYHATLINDLQGMRIYVNGEEKAQGPTFTTKYNSETPYLISFPNKETNKDNFKMSGYLVGDVDEFRLYNRALNELEIKELYNQ